MENIAPSLECIIDVLYHLKNGVGLNKSIELYSLQHQNDFSYWIKIWLINKKRGLSNLEHEQNLKSPYQKSLIFVFNLGLAGKPIHSLLENLQKEVLAACEDEITKFVATLPFKTMLPLFLLQFPAYLILLIGPILVDISRSFS